MGIFPASVPLENPQWHIKIAPFVCKIAVLNNLWCHFCTERANYHQIYPKWTRQKMQNWKILWWIGSASPHPFGFTIEPFLLPPLHCNPVDIYLKKREVFKKNQMWKNYCAVGKCGERGGVRRPPCARIYHLPASPNLLCLCGRLTICWQNSNSEAYTSPIEDDLNPN